MSGVSSRLSGESVKFFVFYKIEISINFDHMVAALIDWLLLLVGLLKPRMSVYDRKHFYSCVNIINYKSLNDANTNYELDKVINSGIQI